MKLFPPPVLFSNILCNVKLRSDKGHISSVLASENHKFTTALCFFTHCLIKRVSLWRSIWGTCETENNIWTQLWTVNGSSVCSLWSQLGFSFSMLVDCRHWEYFTLVYMLLQFTKLTLIAQFHAIIWMQNIVQLNSHNLILLVPLVVSLSIMNQGLFTSYEMLLL